MINLYAALLGGPWQPDGSGEGDGHPLDQALGTHDQGTDQGQLDTGVLRFAEVFDERLAEAFGEHLPAAALETLAGVESLLSDVALAPAMPAVEEAGAPPADEEAATVVATTEAQSTVWRLQAALHAAAHGLAPATDGDAAQQALIGLDEDAPPLAVPAGVADGTGGTADATEGEVPEPLAAVVAVAAALSTEADADADPEVALEAARSLRGERGSTREAGAADLRAGDRAASTTGTVDVGPGEALEGDEPAADLRTPGREGRPGAGASGESLPRVVRGERLGVEAPLTTTPSEATVPTPRGEVAETGAMRPSAAAATLERVLEAAARLDRMPPPRQLTLEVGDARVRLGIEDGVLRVQLVGESQPEDRDLLRDVTAELRSRGFDLGRGDGDGRQPGPGQQPTSPGRGAPTGAARAATAMPTNATTDLRL
jgi:hypothetical protein